LKSDRETNTDIDEIPNSIFDYEHTWDQDAGASSGISVVGYTFNDALVSESAFAVSPLVQSGRIFTEVQGSVTTGVAIANPNAEPITLEFYFTDESGSRIHADTTTVAANEGLTAFLNEDPFIPPSSVNITDARSFTFSASLPIAFTAIRGFVNERSEFLMTTLPVAALHQTDSSPIAVPYYVDGAGWSSRILLVNPTETTISGTVDFFAQSSADDPLNSASIDGELTETAQYAIPGGSAVSIQSSLLQSEHRTGWARLVPDQGTAAPVGSIVFSRWSNGITVSESGAAALQADSSFRVYAEAAGNFRQGEAGSIQSGVAISNSSSNSALIHLELLALDGSPTGMFSQATIPPLGQVRLFLDEVPGLLPPATPFNGFIRISGDAVAVVGLRARHNERGDFLVFTMPAIAESDLTLSSNVVHHYFVHGGGFMTAFIPFLPPAE
jgi:hypothetical protein